MTFFSRLLSTLSGLFRRDRLEREMDAELRFHMSALIDDQIKQGIAPAEAKRRALAEFGAVQSFKEDCRQARGLALLDQLGQDLRYGLRMLRKNPTFALIAILTLAAGIGANTAIFSVVNSVLLRPLPYANPSRLYTLKSNQSLPDLEDIKDQCQSFDALGGITLQALDYTGGAEPVQIQAGLVNADFFNAVGVAAAIGRTISEHDDRYGAEPVVVLSDAFWRRFLNAAPSAIGKSIPLSGNSYTIVGVMPVEFSTPIFGKFVGVWASVKVVNPVAAKFRGVHFLRTCLRLRQGISVAQARSEFEGIDDWLAGHYPENNNGRRSVLIPLRELAVKDTRPALIVLFGAVTLVLLIACSNFANLLLARSAARGREMIVRASLGAGRARLIRQMLTETMILSMVAGGLGLAIAKLGISSFLAAKPDSLVLPGEVGIDGRVLGFTLAMSFVTGVVFGLMPAFQAAGFSITQRPQIGGATMTAGGRAIRARQALMIAEVALALVLLIGAGLLIRGLSLLSSVDPGLDTKNLLTMRIELPETRYKEIPKQTQFREQLLDGLNSLGGVHAAMVSELPLSGAWLDHAFVIEGRPPLPAGSEPDIQTRTVSANYFDTMGIRLLRGRDFGAEDRADHPPVGLINASLAREYFPGSDPIGARISWARGPRNWMTIIGVVADVKHFGLDAPEQPAFYNLYDQLDEPWKRWMYLTVRGEAPASTLLTEIKQQVWRLDGQIPLSEVSTMDEVIASSKAARQFNMLLMSTFAFVAVSLAAIGIFGVVSYSVTQRSNEFGVRLALGAKPGHLVATVVKQGLAIALTGAAIGTAAAAALTRLMSGLLFGVSPLDPITFAAVTLLLIAIALVASYIPARRAARTNPMSALRTE